MEEYPASRTGEDGEKVVTKNGDHVQQLPTPADSPQLRPVTDTSKQDANAIQENGTVNVNGTKKPAKVQAREEDGQHILAPVSISETSHLGPHAPTTTERKRSISKIGSPDLGDAEHFEKVQKLSPVQLEQLISEPTSLPVRAEGDNAQVQVLTPIAENGTTSSTQLNGSASSQTTKSSEKEEERIGRPRLDGISRRGSAMNAGSGKTNGSLVEIKPALGSRRMSRPELPSRTASTPPFIRRRRSSSKPQALQEITNLSKTNRAPPPPTLNLKDLDSHRPARSSDTLRPSPLQDAGQSPLVSLPLPPLSLHTFLQLELAADGPSPLYIHRSLSADKAYESTEIIFERLRNFVGLPSRLEQCLIFGAVACLDAWLYVFTILPLRFFRALYILLLWWPRNAWKEVHDLLDFVWQGLGRIWSRRHTTPDSVPPTPFDADGTSQRASKLNTPAIAKAHTRDGDTNGYGWPELPPRKPRRGTYRHRRTRSTISLLQTSHKADLLKGLLVVISCWFLMYMDPSRMYHTIRGQSAMKLYVIYNLIEVFDRMLSAIGQDILEALFSRECLGRGADGRSKVIRPLWVFLMALVYNTAHAAALFYQVITLNVAVNSYSNALVTLLMSNQFVEIKGTVFKKFEKENLFQLTCADMVERFQLWLMLLIIALRNIVEVGGINIASATFSSSATTTASSMTGNITGTPIIAGNILPKAFTILPKWTGDVLAPFLIVLGSEMAVDWLKHCFITKFNNYKPQIYGTFLDVVAKDYYVHAFADQNLNKRLGLPVFPLACLFIRSSVQTYQMFIATHGATPTLLSKATALAEPNPTSESISASAVAFTWITNLVRQFLGLQPVAAVSLPSFLPDLSADTVITILTTIVFISLGYILLLSIKLLLGMLLLSYSRKRYKSMKDRADKPTSTAGKRFGGWGVIEVDEEKRNWIYKDDPETLARLKEKEAKVARERDKSDGRSEADKLERVKRYDMVAKRIW